MTNDKGAKIVLDLIQERLDYTQAVWFHWLPNTLLKLSPLEVVLSRVLYEDDVWPPTRREQYLAVMAQYGSTVGSPNLQNVERSGCSFSVFLAEITALAESEDAQGLREWHIAKMIVTRGRNTFLGLGINPDQFLQRVGMLCGRLELGDEDKAKTWCFCDTNLFLHYRLFDQVDWRLELGFKSVVLVIPTMVIRELDRLKFDYQRERLRKRSRQVLPRIIERALAGSPETPTPIRSGVELLILSREPANFGDDLDPQVADDRLIAAALEFRWTHPGATVVILSGDGLVRVKAHARGLVQREPPSRLEEKATETITPTS